MNEAESLEEKTTSEIEAAIGRLKVTIETISVNLGSVIAKASNARIDVNKPTVKVDRAEPKEGCQFVQELSALTDDAKDIADDLDTLFHQLQT